MKRYTEQGAMAELERQRKESEDHARHMNAKEEERNPEYKKTMDKVRAAMQDHPAIETARRISKEHTKKD